MPESVKPVPEAKPDRVADGLEALDVKAIATDVLRKVLTLAQRQAKVRRQRAVTAENVDDVLRKVTTAVAQGREAVVHRLEG